MRRAENKEIKGRKIEKLDDVKIGRGKDSKKERIKERVKER